MTLVTRSAVSIHVLDTGSDGNLSFALVPFYGSLHKNQRNQFAPCSLQQDVLPSTHTQAVAVLLCNARLVDIQA